jgi:hypothetical protein
VTPRRRRYATLLVGCLPLFSRNGQILLPYVNKFVALTIKFPIESGEDKERYYNRIHLIFLKENSGIKFFDPYRPAWEYLKESPKFISMTAATNAAPRVVSSMVTDDDNVEYQCSVSWRHAYCE